jgi:hypothetical protein
MKVTRRFVLRGMGGVALSLPLLESFGTLATPARAKAQDAGAGTSFAVFFRQANGVACEQDSQLGTREPERFWPTQPGALSAATMDGRAVSELAAYRDKLLIVGGVNMNNYDFGDGHARGALQGLTARGPVSPGAGGSSEAAGMSLDHRIGAELNPGGRDSLFLYAGPGGGWLGGPCISYRGADERRAAFRNPRAAFETVSGGTQSASQEAQSLLQSRKQSIHDLVRGQMQRLLRQSRLSASDKSRLQLHFDSIRELEVALGCQADQALEQRLDGVDATIDSGDGDDVWMTTRLHMDIAAMAIACGQTRSVAIQIGNGNDGSSRYRDPDSGQLMENFHFISHRRASHDDSGAAIPDADLLHHKIDRQFAQAFKYLLDRLAAYAMPDGQSLLDHGIAVWYNDLGNGPNHSPQSTPFIVAGSASGYLKQGEYVKLAGGAPNHKRMLNTLGAAVGLTNQNGEPLDDFGDPDLQGGQLRELLA